jgi:signal transduction histidine kinase
VPAPADRGSSAARLWASRWPEVAWTVFALGNLSWMVLMPSQAVLPFHFIWISLLLLYGLGYRTYSRTLTWCLLVPVMAGAALLFIDARIRALGPYDELIELPVMIVMVFAISRHTSRRAAAMAALDEVSRRNKRLLERQRAFVQNASHELRTPITVALAHAELLPKAADAAAGVDGGVSAEIAEDAAIITDELVRLHGLVDRLLLLATAEQADLLRSAPVQLAPLAADLLRRWEPVPRQWLAGRMDHAVVLADKDRLTLALDAIVDNAVRFTGDGDQIEVSVACHNGTAAITVSDTGPGIPAEQLDWVFDKFARAGPSHGTARNFGLGLPIVRATAEAHGGQVTARRDPSGGTAVTFTIPLCRSRLTRHRLAYSTVMSEGVHKPGRQLTEAGDVLLGFLDYYRSVIARKVSGLTEAELRTSRLPSGWTPLELVKHLVYMEQRWLRWGFLAEQMPAPHGDEDESGRWHVGPDDTAADLLAALHAVGEQTRLIVAGADLADISRVGGRFSDQDRHPPPSLIWILVYLLQEYSRHAGHLDVARELADGATGE